jgi:hypothetical protein
MLRAGRGIGASRRTLATATGAPFAFTGVPAAWRRITASPPSRACASGRSKGVINPPSADITPTNRRPFTS